MYSVAIIGTGNSETAPGREGSAMAYLHADGYVNNNSCEIVACADIVQENAERFATTFDIAPSNVYGSHTKLLQCEEIDIVSICTPPATHTDIVIDCIQNEDVAAIHCEKPVSTTWGECLRMRDAYIEGDTQLSFNLQRRFSKPYREAKKLIDDGEIGSISRIEVSGWNLFDSGSHWIDLANYLIGEVNIEWVLAQVEYLEENVWYGAHNENRSICHWEYENGIHGITTTGDDGEFVGCHHRLEGSKGVIEVGNENGPALRIRRHRDDSWEVVDCNGESCHSPVEKTPESPGYVDRAINEVVTALHEERDPEMDIEAALRTTEVIFACWESSRRRGRVGLPLEVTDNPLEAMVEEGELLPE